jgi:hypothetical protein
MDAAQRRPALARDGHRLQAAASRGRGRGGGGLIARRRGGRGSKRPAGRACGPTPPPAEPAAILSAVMDAAARFGDGGRITAPVCLDLALTLACVQLSAVSVYRLVYKSRSRSVEVLAGFRRKSFSVIDLFSPSAQIVPL